MSISIMTVKRTIKDGNVYIKLVYTSELTKELPDVDIDTSPKELVHGSYTTITHLVNDLQAKTEIQDKYTSKIFDMRDQVHTLVRLLDQINTTRARMVELNHRILKNTDPEVNDELKKALNSENEYIELLTKKYNETASSMIKA